MSNHHGFDGGNNAGCCAVSEMEDQVVTLDINLEKRNQRLVRKIDILIKTQEALKKQLETKRHEIMVKDQEIAKLRRYLKITWDLISGLTGDKKISDEEFQKTYAEVKKWIEKKKNK